MKIDISSINNYGIYSLDFNYYLNYDFDSILQYNSLLNDSIFTTFKVNYLDKTTINQNSYNKLQSKIDSLIGDTQNDPFTFTFIDFSSIHNIKELQKKIYIDQNLIFENFLHYCKFISS